MEASPKNYQTVSEAISDLAKRGYTTDFSMLVRNDTLMCNNPVIELSLEEFEIDETYRFEGMTDPGDEMIIFAISSLKYNVKGTLTNGYGIYSDPVSDKIVERLKKHLS